MFHLANSKTHLGTPTLVTPPSEKKSSLRRKRGRGTRTSQRDVKIANVIRGGRTHASRLARSIWETTRPVTSIERLHDLGDHHYHQDQQLQNTGSSFHWYFNDSLCLHCLAELQERPMQAIAELKHRGIATVLLLTRRLGFQKKLKHNLSDFSFGQ